MKIYFIGLSCFLIENENGFIVLFDPFNNDPKWSLGLTFPSHFNSKPFGANIVLSSEPDADHAYSPGDFLLHAPKTLPNSNPFPGFNIKGTVIYEFNGDVNIAWNCTIDGVRFLHLADNAHILTNDQIKEIGEVDIIFISPPKVNTFSANDTVKYNINLLKPKVVIWSHHIIPDNLDLNCSNDHLRIYFRNFFKQNAYTNFGYRGGDDFIQLCYILENAKELNEYYNGIYLKEVCISINKDDIDIIKKPKAILFTRMLAKPSQMNNISL